ncbi:MAG: DUF11 domain-containing protein [Candidatus Peribacteria bacterium]|nr:DUF11 domain-containing protein [Candidatus Peribacteria bacterium]
MADAALVALEDYLPQNLEYVSSQLFMNPPYNAGQYRSGGVFIDAYSGMILPPGASGYLLLTGKVLSINLNSTTNVACIYLYSADSGTGSFSTGFITRPLCAQVTYKVKPMDLGITKKVSYNSSVLLDSVQVPRGSEVIFTIFVKNNGTTPVSGFSVRDTLPMEVEFVDWVNGTWNSAGFASRYHNWISGSEILVWSGYQDLLLPGDQVILKFRAKVEIPNGTIRTNIACLEYFRSSEKLNQDVYCDTASVETKEKQYCVAPTTSPGGTIWVTGNEEKRITVTCSTSDGKAANIKIYCDRNQGVTKE